MSGFIGRRYLLDFSNDFFLHPFWSQFIGKFDCLLRANYVSDGFRILANVGISYINSFHNLYLGKAAATPPSTAITLPVVREDSSLKRNAAARATSRLRTRAFSRLRDA